MINPQPSPAQLKALRNAAKRPHGTVCPTVGVSAAAQTALLAALLRRGWIKDHADMAAGMLVVPIITDAGREVVAKAQAQ